MGTRGIFDLMSLRKDVTEGWPEASNQLRALLCNSHILKVCFGDESIHNFAWALGLGIARTLRRGETEPIGPFIDLRSMLAATLQRPSDNIGETWPSLARRFLGFRLCMEEMGCN